jgi:hypothetical protein
VTAIRIPARDAGRKQIIDGETFRRPSLTSECVFFPAFVHSGRSEHWTRVSGERAAPGQRDSTVYTTNMATPAANIATVVIATTIQPRRELGWPSISFLSKATTRIATRRKGANNPLMTAVQ